MSLTASEEALVRQLLDQQAAILSLAGNEATITSKLGATKVTLADLVAASAVADADLLLARQGTTDKSVRVDTLAAYMEAELNQTFAKIASPTFTGDPKAPTAAQFDKDTSLATTAFVQRALGSIQGIVTYAAPQTLSAADVGKLVLPNSAGSITLTLPLASSLVVGATIHFRNAGAGLASLACAGADIFYRAGLLAPFSTLKLASNDSVSLVASVTGWELFAGSAALRAATGDFGASLAASGYQKLPSGLIIQWGISAVTTTSASVTFPIAFPNYVAHVNTHDQSNSPTRSIFQVTGLTKTGFVATNIGTLTRGSTTFNAVADAGCPWIAIGY